MDQFLTPSFSPEVIQVKTASYTALMTDDEIRVNGAYTVTLPVISTMSDYQKGAKTLKIKNINSTTVTTVTITAGTGDTIEDGSSAGASSIYLYANDDYVILEADIFTKQWKRRYPKPQITDVHRKDGEITGEKLSLDKHYFTTATVTSGTTAQNVFGSAGAPDHMTIVTAFCIAQDTNAGNIVIKNGTNTVATFAKQTTAGYMQGEDGSLANTSVAAAATCTVESSTTNGNGMVVIVFTSP